MKTLENNDNKVKLYGIIIGVVTLALQHGIYLLGNELAGLVGIPAYLPKISAIDDLIPIVPVFILPYVWSYIYWAMAPMAVSKCEFKHFLNYLASYTFACLAGALVLTFAPTYMDRVAEGLLDYSKTDFFSILMRFWYSLDGGERAYNLLPSFHCINSTISYLGVAGRKEIPKWFRVYSLVITVIIYASTLFVKQHYVLDVVSGIAIAVIAFFVCKKLNAGRIFMPVINYVRKLFKKEPLILNSERLFSKNKQRGDAEHP